MAANPLFPEEDSDGFREAVDAQRRVVSIGTLLNEDAGIMDPRTKFRLRASMMNKVSLKPEG